MKALAGIVKRTLFKRNKEQDYRTIVNLLTDQIEFANVIIINKIDLVSPEQTALIEAIITKLNPSAKAIKSAFGKVDPSLILNTGLKPKALMDGSGNYRESRYPEAGH